MITKGWEQVRHDRAKCHQRNADAWLDSAKAAEDPVLIYMTESDAIIHCSFFTFVLFTWGRFNVSTLRVIFFFPRFTLILISLPAVPGHLFRTIDFGTHFLPSVFPTLMLFNDCPSPTCSTTYLKVNGLNDLAQYYFLFTACAVCTCDPAQRWK